MYNLKVVVYYYLCQRCDPYFKNLVNIYCIILIFHCWVSFKKLSSVCARLLNVIKTEAAIIDVIWLLHRVGVICKSKRTNARRDGSFYWTNFCIECSTTNLILTLHHRWISVCNFCAWNHQPIIGTWIWLSCRTTAYHRHNLCVAVAWQCETSTAIRARRIGTWLKVNRTEIPLSSNADAVILIGQLSTRAWIKVETLNPSTDTWKICTF